MKELTMVEAALKITDAQGQELESAKDFIKSLSKIEATDAEHALREKLADMEEQESHFRD